MSNVSRITWGAFFVALGITLPIGFHMVGLGRAFLPMHIPVLLAALLLDSWTALWVAVAAPLLSSVLTGMPALVPPIALTVVAELVVYATFASVLRRRYRFSVYPSLVVALLAGRLSYGVFSLILLPVLGLPRLPALYPVTAGLIASLPGLLVQITVIPPIVLILEKSVASLRKRHREVAEGGRS